MQQATSVTPSIAMQPQPVLSTDADPRRTRILATSIYRELRHNGLSEHDVLAIATELLSQLADDLRAAR